MKFHSLYHRILPILLGTVLGLTFASQAVHATNGKLLGMHSEIRNQLENSRYGIPIVIQSTNSKNRPKGEVYAIIQYPFLKVQQALARPANWCDIVPQHLNIKACSYQHLNDQCRLTFYSGRKYYEEPKNTYRIDYLYQAETTASDYFQVELTAKEGPLGTSDYRILVEAIPLSESETFIHFNYTFHQGFWARMATQGYLATLGSDKVGFSVESTNKDDKPEYINGIRGILERNAVRYYFAIQSYLATQNDPQVTRFLSRVTNWYELTEKYPEQLYELDRKEYISSKIRERANQKALQNKIGHNEKACAQQIKSS